MNDKKKQNIIDIADAAEKLTAGTRMAEEISNVYTALPTQVVTPKAYEIMQPHPAVAAAATAFAAASQAVVPDMTMPAMAAGVQAASAALNQNWAVDIANSGLLTVLEQAVKTPELVRLEENIQQVTAGAAVFADYAQRLSGQWEAALNAVDMASRCMAAQDFAMLRVLPNYQEMTLPRGSKKMLHSLTQSAAKKLTQSDKILLDLQERKFFHRDSPDQKITADQITVLDSSLRIFADISLDELVSFESRLYENPMAAMHHPTGCRIFDIIKSWSHFVDFEDKTYYHARALAGERVRYLDQEMLQAPRNVSSHGRYNDIGRSCYYIAETRAGAINEIKKHSGGAKVKIQVAGLHPVKSAKIIDLSGDVKQGNHFMDHLRNTVENEEGKIVQNYLLPNFVASCCKELNIEGIRYRSGDYNCIVLWQDYYFEFVEGSRDIVLS